MFFDSGEGGVGLILSIKHQTENGDARPVCTWEWRLPRSARETIREQYNKMLSTRVTEPLNGFCERERRDCQIWHRL